MSLILSWILITYLSILTWTCVLPFEIFIEFSNGHKINPSSGQPTDELGLHAPAHALSNDKLVMHKEFMTK